MAIGRIAVMISEIFDPLDYELLNGIHTKASSLGYDTICLTGIRDVRLSTNNKVVSDKMDNVYTLIRSARFDGIIFIAESFYNAYTEQTIFSMLSQISVPCVVLGRNKDGFHTIPSDQRSVIRRLTEHLIVQHNCRHFAFVSGFKGEFNSEERYAGFLEALSDAGLDFCEEKDLYFGEFWKQPAEQIGKEIAARKENMPDAIVCASDLMAIYLSEGLMSSGVSVPEDVKITGYDGEWYAVLHTPSITTASGCKYDEGQRAVTELYHYMTGKVSYEDDIACKICFGTSCGCKPDMKYSSRTVTKRNWIERELLNIIDKHLTSGRYLNNDIYDHVSRADTFDSLIQRIHDSAESLQGWYRIAICLCSDWRFDFDRPEIYRREGFSDTMQLVMDNNRYAPNIGSQSFPITHLLPMLEQEHSPVLVTISALNNGEQILGYTAFYYSDVDSINYDAQFMNWNNTAASGFRLIQQKLYQEYKQRKNIAFSTIDPTTGFYNQRGFFELLSSRNESECIFWLFGIYEDNDMLIAQNDYHFFSTTLRLSSDPDEDIAALGNHLFAVVFKKSGISAVSWAFQRMLRCMREAERLQPLDHHSRFPCVLSISALLDGTAEQKQQKAAELAEAARQRLCSGNQDTLRSDLLWLKIRIWLHPEADLSVEDMSRELHISPTYLHRIYKKEFGISAKEDVILARIEKAKQLLLSSGFSVNEIAEQCGYHEPSHFMRQFRDRVGMTAMGYRKNNSK